MINQILRAKTDFFRAGCYFKASSTMYKDMKLKLTKTF